MKNESSEISESSSDDNTESAEDEQDNSVAVNSRHKRDIAWCGVDNESQQYYTPPRRVVVWPPPSSSSSSSTHAQVRWPPPSSSNSSLTHGQVRWQNVRMGNPNLGAKMQLYCKTGHHLAVYPDGNVRGNPDEDDLHTYLELSSAGYPGHVRIQALLTKLYVGMDKKGRLYGEVDPVNESTAFIESFQGSYNSYLSRKYAHLGWYIGLKKSGKFKRGPKTAYGQKAVKFLPRRNRFQ